MGWSFCWRDVWILDGSQTVDDVPYIFTVRPSSLPNLLRLTIDDGNAGGVCESHELHGVVLHRGLNMMHLASFASFASFAKRAPRDPGACRECMLFLNEFWETFVADGLIPVPHAREQYLASYYI